MATLLEQELVLRLMVITLESLVNSYENSKDELEKSFFQEKYQETFEKYLQQTRKFTNSKQ